MKRLKISIILMIALAAVTGTAFAAPFRLGALTNDTIGIPSRVALDAQGNVYVSEPAGNIVRKYSSKGAFLGSLSVPRPQGIAVSPGGLIYVCSAKFTGKLNKNAVYIFTPDFAAAGSLGVGEGEFGTPMDIDLDANGMVYVVDTYNNLVKVYNPQGANTATFGGYDGATGGTPGKLRKPIGVAVNVTTGEVYVTDVPNVNTTNGVTDGVRISVFDKNGTFLRSFGDFGTGVGQIGSPVEIALDKAGILYVSDSLQNVVHILNPADGTSVGEGGLYDLTNPGSSPAGIAISRNNLAYVAYGMNTKSGRVDVYALDGYVTMNASPVTMAFVGRQQSGNPAPQTVTIANSGSGTLNWTASANTSWLVLDQTSGSAGPASSSNLTVRVDISSLTVGTQTGTITIASDFGERQAISVVLTVNPAPYLILNPGMLNFTARKGKSAPSPQTVTITITDAAGTMNWTAASDSSWLSIAPASGTATTLKSSVTATVSVNTTGLNVGNHSGIITVSAPGAIGDGSKINVALTITSTKISVTTSPASATFTVSGPATYPMGTGPTWSVDNAPAGDYTITYNDVPGYKTPAPQTKNLAAYSDLAFVGKYWSKKNIIVAKGPGEKNDALVKAYQGDAQPAKFDLVALNTRYGANVAVGDIDGDGAAELVVGAGCGPRNAATVRIFRADKTLVTEFTPLSTLNGARIAVADLDGDGKAEVIVAPAGGSDNDGRVVVYSYDKVNKRMASTGISFSPYPSYTGGVNIAAADLDGTGRPQIITAPGFSAQNPGLVTVWSVDMTNGPGAWNVTKVKEIQLSSAFGATIAAGDVDGDGRDEIIAGTTGNGSTVTTIKAADWSQSAFRAFDKYGVNVAAADLDGDGVAEIIAAQGPESGDQGNGAGATTATSDKLSKKKDSKEKETEYSDADQERGLVRVYSAAGTVKNTVMPFEGSGAGINLAVGDLGL